MHLVDRKLSRRSFARVSSLLLDSSNNKLEIESRKTGPFATGV